MTDQPSEQMPLDSSLAPAKLPVPNCQTTPPHSGQFSLAGRPILDRAPNCQTGLGGAENSNDKLNPDDLLTELVELRERMLAGMDYLYRHLEDDERFARGRHRLTHILVEEYLPRIEQLRTVADTGDLAARRDDAERRLAIGWGVEKPGAGERFAELAVRYAVLSDALTDTVVAPWLDRIGLLEAPAA